MSSAILHRPPPRPIRSWRLPRQAAQEALNQSAGSAAVIDSIATHLGSAADNLAIKIQQIVDHYGPGAAQLIHEIGRVKALSDLGPFLIAAAFLCLGLVKCLNAWTTFDNLPDKDDDLAGSTVTRIVIFGVMGMVSLLAVINTFSLAAIYGIFSPEAYLIMRLIKLN